LYLNGYVLLESSDVLVNISVRDCSVLITTQCLGCGIMLISVSVMQWADHSAFYWPYERCAECCFFCWQSSDRVWFTGQNDKAVEHTWSVQVHYSGLADFW